MKIIKSLIPYAVIFVVVVVIRTFFVTPVMVSGLSMSETLDDGDVLLVDKISSDFKYGDIVIFNYENEQFIKRIIGVPGQTVRYIDGVLYIDGYEVLDKFAPSTNDFDLKEIGHDFIEEGYYFVMGDNRDNSIDSRFIGLIKEEDIEGKTTISLWPPKKITD